MGEFNFTNICSDRNLKQNIVQEKPMYTNEILDKNNWIDG